MDFPHAELASGKPELALQSLDPQGFACARQRNWAAKRSRQTLVRVQAPALARRRLPAEARIACSAPRFARAAPRPHPTRTISAARLLVLAKRAASPAICGHSPPPPREWRPARIAAPDQSSYSRTNR